MDRVVERLDALVIGCVQAWFVAARAHRQRLARRSVSGHWGNLVVPPSKLNASSDIGRTLS
jgi:hypothetical protein